MGQFHYQDENGNLISFIGAYHNDQPHGMGKLIYQDGIVEEGEWINGKFKEEINALQDSSVRSHTDKNSIASSKTFKSFSKSQYFMELDKML